MSQSHIAVTAEVLSPSLRAKRRNPFPHRKKEWIASTFAKASADKSLRSQRRWCCSTQCRHHPRRRVIQYPAASRLSLTSLEYWVTRSSRAMTAEHGCAFSRRDAPEVCWKLHALENKRAQG